MLRRNFSIVFLLPSVSNHTLLLRYLSLFFLLMGLLMIYKVCSVDKDDDVVLLCDICEGEYHIYCLEPPLHTVPDGEWYCPLCVSPETVAKDGCHVSELPEKLKEEESETSEDQVLIIASFGPDLGNISDELPEATADNFFFFLGGVINF